MVQLHGYNVIVNKRNTKAVKNLQNRKEKIMKTLAIIIFVCGWLAAIFIAGCIMEATVTKLEKMRKKHKNFRRSHINKNSIQRSA